MSAIPDCRLSAVGEDELIRRFTAGLSLGPSVIAGPGDDCAIVQSGRKGMWQLLKTDCVVEGIHFLREADPAQIGWKAMARAVSDIASMGGTPEHALVTVVLLPDLEEDYATGLYAGLRHCADTFGISIVGGETTRSPLIMISVALTGSVKAARCVRRSGAQTGDLIYVTGRLGGSLPSGRHLTFMPRLAEAQWLAGKFTLHSMMDLSDGLAKDLPRLALASGVGFALHPDALPLHPGCSVSDALGDGEDYELLFSVTPRSATRMETAWAEKFPTIPLTRIGQIVPAGQGSSFVSPGTGWDAFTPATTPA